MDGRCRQGEHHGPQDRAMASLGWLRRQWWVRGCGGQFGPGRVGEEALA